MYDSPNKSFGKRAKAKTSIITNDEEKMKTIINNKMINNTITNNYLFFIRKPYYSFSKNKLSDKFTLYEIDKTIDNNKKRKDEIFKTIKIYQSQTIEQKINPKINKFGSILKNKNNNNSKSFNKKFDKLSNKNINAKSVKHYTTTQSTLPGFSNILSPNKRSKRNVSKSISKYHCIKDIKHFKTLIKYRKHISIYINLNCSNNIFQRENDGILSYHNNNSIHCSTHTNKNISINTLIPFDFIVDQDYSEINSNINSTDLRLLYLDKDLGLKDYKQDNNKVVLINLKLRKLKRKNQNNL